MRPWTLALAPLALAGLAACGGRSDATGPRLDADGALAMTAPFLQEQSNQTGETDDSGPMTAGEALAFLAPPAPACVTAGTPTATSITWTLVNCAGPHGWVWNGRVVMTWKLNADGTILVRHDHQNLVGAKDGRTWTLNGARANLRNPATRSVRIVAEPGFTKTWSDNGRTTVYAYGLDLTADWSTTGTRRLQGRWSLTPTTGDALSAVIPATSPLTWERGANCCYPVSGTLNLAWGARTATLVHGLPCGTLTVNGEARVLPACGP